MKLFLLTVITSSVVSLLVSRWYLQQMAKRLEQYIEEFLDEIKQK